MAARTKGWWWDWIFWTITVFNGIGALALIFASEGSQDAAGRGMQAGFGVILLATVAALAGFYWLFKTPFVRVPVFLVMTLPNMVLLFFVLSP